MRSAESALGKPVEPIAVFELLLQTYFTGKDEIRTKRPLLDLFARKRSSRRREREPLYREKDKARTFMSLEEQCQKKVERRHDGVDSRLGFLFRGKGARGFGMGACARHVIYSRSLLAEESLDR